MVLFAGKSYKRVSLFSISAVLAVSSLASLGSSLLTETASATAGSAVVYNALPSDNPINTNYASIGYQATSTSEFGDYVHLGGDTNRTLNTVIVTMSDWAKYSDYSSNVTYSGNNSTWSLPVTLNVYSSHLGLNEAPDTVLATKTQTFSIPWRPESDPTCGSTSNGNGWKVDGTCYDFSGIASNITFDLSSLNVALPNNVILGVAYNTQTHGYIPTGVAGPYSSLNVAVPGGQAVTVGSDDNTNNVFWNTSYAGFYTDGGAGGTNTFRQDVNWAPNGTVAFKITATPMDTSSTTFVNGPKYVRINTGGDLAAQIVTPDATTGVRFFVDGDTSAPINGSNVGGAGATTNWWRLYASLSAGEHTITGQVEIYGNWYPITGSGTVYSLDLPWAQYVIPQAGQFFRPNDKVVRIKSEDQFNQFKYMNTTINGVTYTVNKAECTDNGDYVLCDLQNLNLPEGTYTASTITYTQANNRVDNLVSVPFTIDGTRPVLTNFQITNPQPIYTNNIQVSADATDANGINSVTFYITEPRVSDGVCDGNGTQLTAVQGVFVIGSTYAATINTNGLNGEYCVNAIAADMAANHSNPVLHTKVVIDNTAPVIALQGANPQIIERGTSYNELGATVSDDTDSSLVATIDASNVDTSVAGTYTVKYDAVDAVGNNATQVARTVNVVDTILPSLTSVSIISNNTHPEFAKQTNKVTVNFTADESFASTPTVTIAGVPVTVTGSGVTWSAVHTMSATDAEGYIPFTINFSDISSNAGLEVITTTDGSTVLYDKTKPTVSITTTETSPTKNSPIHVTFTFSEPVMNFAIGDIAVTNATKSSFVKVDPTTIDGRTYITTYTTDIMPITDGAVTITILAGKANDVGNNGNIATTPYTIVYDSITPTINLAGDNPQTIEAGTAYVELGATVSEGLTAIINSSSVDTSTVGSYLVTYDAVDIAGNNAPRVTRTVSVVDITKPVITLVGANPQIIEVGTAYSELGATVADNYDSGLTTTINATAVNIVVVNSYLVTYNVTDANGNTADQVTRTVNVVDTTPHNITIPLAPNDGDATVPLAVVARMSTPTTPVVAPHLRM